MRYVATTPASTYSSTWQLRKEAFILLICLTSSLNFSDAASFGTAGLAGIKVVEINGVTGQLQPYHVS